MGISSKGIGGDLLKVESETVLLQERKTEQITRYMHFPITIGHRAALGRSDRLMLPDISSVI